jgi:hypothetical protein
MQIHADFLDKEKNKPGRNPPSGLDPEPGKERHAGSSLVKQGGRDKCHWLLQNSPFSAFPRKRESKMP